jgi:C-terminus of AA_permease
MRMSEGRSSRCCRAAVSLLLMLSLPWATWERLILWMAIGVAFYFAYGFRHSRLRTEPGREFAGPATRDSMRT